MSQTPVLISNEEMRNHQMAGEARPQSPGVPDFIVWRGIWWMATPDGWLRVADEIVARTLDRIRRRFDTLQTRGQGWGMAVQPDEARTGQ